MHESILILASFCLLFAAAAPGGAGEPPQKNPFFEAWDTPFGVPPFDRIVASMHEFHFLGIVFAYLVLLMLIVGELRPLHEEWEQQDVKAVDMTPWPGARKAGAVLLLLVLSLYACFADFSVLG